MTTLSDSHAWRFEGKIPQRDVSASVVLAFLKLMNMKNDCEKSANNDNSLH